MIDDGMSSTQIAKQLRDVVSERTIRRWQNLYKTTGMIDLKSPPGRPRIVRTKALIQKVKKRVNSKARQSARKLARSLAVSRETMRRIIKDDLKLRAYHVTSQPKLTENQKKQRMTSARWVRRELRKEDHRRIIFSDEKYCSVEGVFNRQNERVYAADRHHADQHSGIREKSKHPKTNNGMALCLS